MPRFSEVWWKQQGPTAKSTEFFLKYRSAVIGNLEELINGYAAKGMDEAKQKAQDIMYQVSQLPTY